MAIDAHKTKAIDPTAWELRPFLSGASVEFPRFQSKLKLQPKSKQLAGLDRISGPSAKGIMISTMISKIHSFANAQ